MEPYADIPMLYRQQPKGDKKSKHLQNVTGETPKLFGILLSRR
jgi:hypothetical protein